MYLGWYDDNPKKTVHARLAEAVDVYIERFHMRPTVALVNPNEICEVEGLSIQPRAFVRRHNYWIGEETAEPKTAG